jgi:hypothetical protein
VIWERFTSKSQNVTKLYLKIIESNGNSTIEASYNEIKILYPIVITTIIYGAIYLITKTATVLIILPPIVIISLGLQKLWQPIKHLPLENFIKKSCCIN